MSTKIKIDGSDLKKVSKVFRDLGMKDQSNILMSSYRKALVPLVNTARATAPKGSSLGLSRSIGTEEVSGEVAILAGSNMNTMAARKERGRSLTGKVWYAHLVEMGSWKTGERHWRRSRLVKRGYYKGLYRGGDKSTGVMPASHFWQNALLATEDKVMEIAANEWYNEIERYLRNSNK